MSIIYCGNNARYFKLKNGSQRVGTRYECMRKGVGIGLNMPVDKKYGKEYAPIDSRKIYCGNKKKLPRGYAYLGNGTMCMQKGVGVGKLIKSKRRR